MLLSGYAGLLFPKTLPLPTQTGAFIYISPLNYPVVLGLYPSCVKGVESIKLAGMK